MGLLAAAVSLRAGGPAAIARDVLVYPDGDRVQGRLIEKTGETIVFQSDRFGLLRVPVAGAQVIVAAKPAGSATPPAVVAAAPEVPGAESAEDAGVTAALARFAAKLRAGFQPWTGRFAFSSEMVTDTAQRSNLSVELQLQRKWQGNEVQVKGRYDFNQTDGRTTTDMLKADGLWRHDFPNTSFVLYRPALEWSQASFRNGVPSDYLLLQQEIGVGMSLLATARAKVRTGASENLFDVWSLVPGGGHDSRTSESVFVENEVKLPWSLLISQRGVFYYSLVSGNDGWENRVELSKKFTKTFSTAIRHEIREGSPDGTAQDYRRLKLLFGLDF